jgi:hypothetical protein
VSAGWYRWTTFNAASAIALASLRQFRLSPNRHGHIYVAFFSQDVLINEDLRGLEASEAASTDLQKYRRSINQENRVAEVVYDGSWPNEDLVSARFNGFTKDL